MKRLSQEERAARRDLAMAKHMARETVTLAEYLAKRGLDPVTGKKEDEGAK